MGSSGCECGKGGKEEERKSGMAQVWKLGSEEARERGCTGGCESVTEGKRTGELRTAKSWN